MDAESSLQDWELVLSADLMSLLIPARQPACVLRPSDVRALPPGAFQALGAVIGRYGLEDLLIVPATAWSCGRRRRRCLYTPLCVLGAGDRAAGLWVQTLPEPGVRAVIPIGQVAAIEQVTAGMRRHLTITGPDGRFEVRFSAAGTAPADALARRLRRRAAGSPGPVPGGSAGRGLPRSWRPVPGMGQLPLDGDEIVIVGRRSPGTSRKITVAVTSRELIISATRAPAGQSRTLYVPRQHFERASFRAGVLRLRSAGTDVPVALRSRKLAAAASWLTEVAGCDHIPADS